MSVKIRRGNADDADFLARVMMLASRGHMQRGVWDLIAGGSEKTASTIFGGSRSQSRSRSATTPSSSSPSMTAGSTLALCGFDPRAGGWQVLGDAMQNVQRQQGWTPADEKASAARTAPVWHCTFDTLDGAWVIESVATLPEFRRRGLVDALIAEILGTGRAHGHRIAQLTILIGNVAAQRAYEKAGFRVRDEKRHRDFQAALGAPGFMRMVRGY